MVKIRFSRFVLRALCLLCLPLVACGQQVERDVWNTSEVTFVDPDSATDEGRFPSDQIDGKDLGDDCGNCVLPDLNSGDSTFPSDTVIPDSTPPLDQNADTYVPDTYVPDTTIDLQLPDTTVPDQQVVDQIPDQQPDLAIPDVQQEVDSGPVCTLTDPLHCGPSCQVCQGATPHCWDGVCTLCNQNSQCGPSCGACPVESPVCRPDGVGCVQCLYDEDCAVGLYCNNLAKCVMCLDDLDCPNGEVCNPTQFVCQPDAPTEGCDSDLTPNAYTCAKAKVIGRKSVAGVKKSFSGYLSKNSANDDDAGSCADLADEEFYRIYLGQGQVMQLEGSTNSAYYEPLLKIYSGTDCDNNGTSDLIICSNAKTGTQTETYEFTAPADGWYSVIIDGNFSGSMFDDGASYTLNVKVICNPTNCGCP